MQIPDVNVLVGAQRNDDSPHAHAMRTWLESALAGHETVGIIEHTLSSMIRVVTHPRVFANPTKPHEALAFADAVMSAPNVQLVRPADRHWPLFSELVRSQRLRANDIPDAYLAALALEAGATFVTADRGFVRFGVRTLDPTGLTA